MKTNANLDFDKETEAAELAQQFVDDIDNREVEEALKNFIENSGRNVREFEARLRAVRFIEKKKREMDKRDDARFLYIILVYLCGVNPLVAGAFCSPSPSPSP